MKKPKIIAVIPAHLASVRFPRKILFPFFSIPMIEHVRRRALLSSNVSEVLVATCDHEIASVVDSFGGNVILTGDHHRNGTTRVAEAIANYDCSHVILLQGDEPLLKPTYIDDVITTIGKNPNSDAWNATGPLERLDDLDRHSFVKCAIAPDQRVLYCFRRSPSCASFEQQQNYIRKILGIIAFRRGFLDKLVKLLPARTEQLEQIEQMRIIENGYTMHSVPFRESLPSVNEPEEAEIVIEYIKKNPEQQRLLETTTGVKI